MKLIDLLVQELPKRGGWPEGRNYAWQDESGEIRFDTIIGCDFFPQKKVLCESPRPKYTIKISASDSFVVTRSQYEAALAASQKPAWNGEGLPPVGCECEWHDANVGWLPVTIKYISEQIVVMESPTIFCGVHELTEIAKDIICDKPQFRPISSEADKKRDSAVEAIDYWMPEFIEDTPNKFYHAKKLYDAIAAGKIPGVKLED